MTTPDLLAIAALYCLFAAAVVAAWARIPRDDASDEAPGEVADGDGPALPAEFVNFHDKRDAA